MLLAIGIYDYQPNAKQKFSRKNFVPKEIKFYSYNPLTSIEEELSHLDALEVGKIKHPAHSDKHLYFYVQSGTVVFAISAKSELEDSVVRFLFVNINHAHFNRGGITLEKIMLNPLGYINKDMFVTQIQANLNETKKIMHANIEKMLDRGEKIEVTLDKTIDLQNACHNYNLAAQKRNRGCC